MNCVLSIRVIGTPAPQGSLRAFNRRGGGRPIVTSDNARTRPWKDVVAWNAGQARTASWPIGGPVQVDIAFRLARPAGHFGKRGLLPSAPASPARKPDLDKLARSCLDALTEAGVWRNDAQVVNLEVRKTYVPEGDVPGALIAVYALPA